MNRIELLNDYVDAQYNDVKGLINIDFHTSTNNLFQLCNDNDINTEHYFPVGLGFMDNNSNNEIVICKVLVIDKMKYGIDYNKIIASTKNIDSIDVISKTFEIKFSDLMRYIKRLDCVGLSNICDNFKSINIEYQ